MDHGTHAPTKNAMPRPAHAAAGHLETQTSSRLEQPPMNRKQGTSFWRELVWGALKGKPKGITTHFGGSLIKDAIHWKSEKLFLCVGD